MAKTNKPNILFIMSDDIGWFNISAYNHGIMGYRTPNIDRIGKEGAMFTDFYGQQSCTAGRAAFITGQAPIRTGLTKVGLPGAKVGLSAEDPTIAQFLKNLGYATGQFGKNHLGDRNLPTVHGFDEFFGNLYHLNAEEEPENPDYPKNPENSAAREWRFGKIGSPSCGSRNSSTFARIRSRLLTTPCSTTSGRPTACSCWFPHRRSLRNGSNRSRSSRSVKSRRASTSTQSCRA
jgi:arylsulfatase A-like enzyme